MLYNICCNPMHPLRGALPGPYVPVWVTCGAWSHIGTLTLTAKHCSTTGFVFSCQYLCEMISETLYLMVWDWQVSRAGPLFFLLALHCLPFLILLIILIYHDFLLPLRKGSHVNSDNTHTIIHIHPLAHIIDTCTLIFHNFALFTVYPNCIM